ncbi:MAG TPA: ABC transporter substrate-binding protein [Paracoccaceae bacterium]|nr:ABC transporter substrate-binding protein [Paracoccaceae bacterium]
MRLNRRGFLAAGAAGAAMVLMSFAATPAWALTAEQARAHVQATVNELVALLQVQGSPESRAPRLRGIMESRGNLPQVARFAAGRVWREMTPQQQERYVDAFSSYVANTYARRFSEYSGNPDIQIGRVIDAGQKGFLVETPIREGGQQIGVSWLISDRGGRVEIVDIVIEGVSMVTTQREEIASMFQRGGQDVDALIARLAGG